MPQHHVRWAEVAMKDTLGEAMSLVENVRQLTSDLEHLSPGAKSARLNDLAEARAINPFHSHKSRNFGGCLKTYHPRQIVFREYPHRAHPASEGLKHLVRGAVFFPEEFNGKERAIRRECPKHSSEGSLCDLFQQCETE
jgi:hypothetical protein